MKRVFFGSIAFAAIAAACTSAQTQEAAQVAQGIAAGVSTAAPAFAIPASNASAPMVASAPVAASGTAKQ